MIFVELGRAVFNRFGEDLQHVAFIIAIDENTESFEFRPEARQSFPRALEARL